MQRWMVPDITYGVTANLCTVSTNLGDFTLSRAKNAKNRALIFIGAGCEAFLTPAGQIREKP